jgi:hypothetical protein
LLTLKEKYYYMKRFPYSLFLLSAAFLAALSPKIAHTEAPPHFIEEDDIVQTLWNGNDDFLYLDIFIPPQCEFADSHEILPRQNGYSCKLSYLVTEDSLAYASSGGLIQDVSIEVQIDNTNTPQLNLAHVTKVTHSRSIDADEILIYRSEECSYTNSIRNPSISLSDRPYFLTFTNEPNIVRVVFTNSFPYSEM